MAWLTGKLLGRDPASFSEPEEGGPYCTDRIRALLNVTPITAEHAPADDVPSFVIVVGVPALTHHSLGMVALKPGDDEGKTLCGAKTVRSFWQCNCSVSYAPIKDQSVLALVQI
jgi:hypothetical protein